MELRSSAGSPRHPRSPSAHRSTSCARLRLERATELHPANHLLNRLAIFVTRCDQQIPLHAHLHVGIASVLLGTNCIEDRHRFCLRLPCGVAPPLEGSPM